MAFEFLNTLKNKTTKVRSINKYKTKFEKETSMATTTKTCVTYKAICNDEHKEFTWKIEFRK